MAVRIRNPLTIVKVEEITTASTSVSITNYDETTGVITGTGFGEQVVDTISGRVLLLDRDTHTYIEQAVTSWSDTSITLTSPIDLSTIQGNTCFVVQTAERRFSQKWMLYGSVIVPGWGLLYVMNSDGTISKIICTSSTDISNLCSTTGTYDRTITINSTTVHTARIVGFQFGSTMTIYTLPAGFMANCMSLNQPIVFPITVTTTASSTYILSYCYTFDCPIVFTNQVRVGDYFLYYCYNFSQPLDLSMFSYLNVNHFMRYCWKFNRPLKLPETLATSYRTIGNYFMSNCRSFDQELTLPTNLTTIGTYFMQNCYGFNKAIDLGNSLSSISNYFMQNCYTFNKILVFPATFTSINNYFMYSCYAFNTKPKFKGTLTSIGNYFLAGSGYSGDIDFISGVRTIGTYFLNACYSFDGEVTLGNFLTSIGNYFMSNCYSNYKKITIPSTVTAVGTYFMQNNYQLREIEVKTTSHPSDTASLATTNINAANYTIGITVTGSGRSSWIGALPDRTSSPYRKLINGGA